MKYRPDIDGLRAIAVLSVVFYHAFPMIVPGGFIGVDIFFVLSGFLISSILFEQIKSGSLNWADFYLRRIKRIFPALILVLFSSLVLGYFLLFPEEYKQLGKHVFGGATFANNILLWREAGYFDEISELKPLLHLWSLAIEEQFYLLWPAFIYLIWRFRLKPAIILLGFTVLSFLSNLILSNNHQVVAFYFPVTRFWELAFGGLLAYAATHTTRLASVSKSRYLSSLSLISLPALIIAIFAYNDSLTYPGWAALLPVLCSVSLIMTSESWVNKKILSLKALVFVGLISYPLYLWHWLFLSFAKIVYSGKVPTLVTISMLGLSFIFAWLTYQYLETPIRRSSRMKKLQPYVVSSLGAGLLSVGLVGLMIHQQGGMAQRAFVQEHEVSLQDITGFEDYRQAALPCDLPKTKQDELKLTFCLQNNKGSPTHVLWGDSHADHLFPGLIKQDPRTNWLLLGHTGCPPLMKVASYWKGGKDECVKANDLILKTILESPSVETVVLTSLGPFYISDESFAADHKGEYSAYNHYLKSMDSNTSKKEAFYLGLNQTIQALQAAGKKVVLVQDTPELPFMPKQCLGRPLSPASTCALSIREVIARQEEYNSVLGALAHDKDIPLYNPLEVICDLEDCKLFKDGRLIYRDSNHMSIYGSEHLAESFVPWLKSNLR